MELMMMLMTLPLTALGSSRMNPEIESIGRQFVEWYYEHLDTNRADLAHLYREESQMTFEGQRFIGNKAINKKLLSLPYTAAKHVITTLDCQLTVNSGILLLVAGQLKTDNGPPHGFSQTFLVQQTPDGDTLYILNDIRSALHSA